MIPGVKNEKQKSVKKRREREGRTCYSEKEEYPNSESLPKYRNPPTMVANITTFPAIERPHDPHYRKHDKIGVIKFGVRDYLNNFAIC